MERHLHDRDRVGVQDAVLLEDYTNENVFVDNLHKRFKEDVIYVSMYLNFYCTWNRSVWTRNIFTIVLKPTSCEKSDYPHPDTYTQHSIHTMFPTPSIIVSGVERSRSFYLETPRRWQLFGDREIEGKAIPLIDENKFSPRYKSTTAHFL